MAEFNNHFHITLKRLEENLSMFKLGDYIRECEEDFDKRIDEIVGIVMSRKDIRVILISGPSASGKTTSTRKIAANFKKKNIKTLGISLDDYYFSHEFPTDEYGRYDYEQITTMDVDLINNNIKKLLSGDRVKIPRFDFITKSRIFDRPEATMGKDAILLVEGLHGLSPQISDNIPKENQFGVYIMPYGTLTDDNVLLDYKDIRMLRRIVRDDSHRGANALSTIDYWPMLEQFENSEFPNYLKRADWFINSILPYEFYCMAPLAKRAIENALIDYRTIDIDNSRLNKTGGFAQIDLALQTINRLYRVVSLIPGINADLVPKDSLLQEFIGC